MPVLFILLIISFSIEKFGIMGIIGIGLVWFLFARPLLRYLPIKDLNDKCVMKRNDLFSSQPNGHFIEGYYNGMNNMVEVNNVNLVPYGNTSKYNNLFTYNLSADWEANIMETLLIGTGYLLAGLAIIVGIVFLSIFIQILFNESKYFRSQITIDNEIMKEQLFVNYTYNNCKIIYRSNLKCNNGIIAVEWMCYIVSLRASVLLCERRSLVEQYLPIWYNILTAQIALYFLYYKQQKPTILVGLIVHVGLFNYLVNIEI